MKPTGSSSRPGSRRLRAAPVARCAKPQRQASISRTRPWPPLARALVRALQRDGAPVDDGGNLVLGAAAPTLVVERFDRLSEPRVLLDHLRRIDAGIAADPAAAIGSAKELVESGFKFVLDDYGVEYPRAAGLTDLYKLVTPGTVERPAVQTRRATSRSAQFRRHRHFPERRDVQIVDRHRFFRRASSSDAWLRVGERRAPRLRRCRLVVGWSRRERSRARPACRR
jgi:hypothetical protein